MIVLTYLYMVRLPQKGPIMCQYSEQRQATLVKHHEPFNSRCRIYSGFHFLLAHTVTHFKHVKDKM